MKRLYSYFVYVFIFFMPGALAGVIYTISKSSVISIYVFIPIIGFLIYWGFIVLHCKRIFYKDSSLYLYNLFSKKQVIVNHDRIRGIDRVIFYDPNFYKITYYDDADRLRYLFFVKNFFIDDFDVIVEKLIDGTVEISENLPSNSKTEIVKILRLWLGSMSKVKAAKIIAVLFIAFMIFRAPKLFYAELFYTHECYCQVRAKQLEINGKITRKYIDSANHLFRSIAVLNSSGDSDNYIFPDIEYDSLWSKIKVNEEIEKNENSLIFYLKNKGVRDAIRVVYDCKN